MAFRRQLLSSSGLTGRPSALEEEQRQKRANDLRNQRRAAENSKAPAARSLAPSDLEPNVLRATVDDAIAIKLGSVDVRGSLAGKRTELLFQKTSTRTRCSFEVGIWDMGGLLSGIDWNASNFLLTDLSDEIQVISRYYDLIVARVKDHADLDRMPSICARHSFPAERFPDFLARYKAAGSISAALKTYGVESTRKSMTITAKLADRADQKLLKQSWPAPIISVESLYVDQRGYPIGHGIARYAGDRIDLQIEEA